ncbi:hypothetical protein BCV69DRAFT_280986 [Microstroma glucosiphilum]|uniref:BTB domain-containing protein n=1 Tax=Pseudomicrostroma glucosiphilum TaxID=1684307 RepID=A0A316UDT8_9BASI|nr:hypothetical protein BCV69DRAFT_280986 [Pseudomicrostroma glucosiphilum]PWN23376.1 hypothetical protein BCV69DRAFT_280986 [Pseudomicrostroma glucosiphilum]
MTSGVRDRSTPTSALASRRSVLVSTTPTAGRPLARLPAVGAERGKVARVTHASKQDVSNTVATVRTPGGLAAKVTELVPQNAQAAAEQAWRDDLRSLWGDTEQRFPDIAWTTRPPAGETTPGPIGSSAHRSAKGLHEEIYAHTALLWLRAPRTFEDKYFRLPIAEAHVCAPSSYSGTQLAVTRSSNSVSRSGLNLRTRPSLAKIGSEERKNLPIKDVKPFSLPAGDIVQLKQVLKYIYTAELDRESEPLSGALSLEDQPIPETGDKRLERLRADLLRVWKSRQSADIVLRVGGDTDSNGPGSAEASPRRSSFGLGEPSISTVSLPMNDAEEEELRGCFSAHRAILVSRSPYFASQFLSGFSDAKATEVNLPTPPFTSSALYFTLGFIYAGKLDFSSRAFDLTIAFQIWRAAAYLQISSLTTVVSSLIYHDFCHKFTCSPPCALCLKRVPRALAFAAASDVGDVVLIELAKKALSGRHFGAYWAREVGSMTSALRTSIVESIKRTINLEPGACVWVLKQIMEVSARLEATRSHKWTDNVREMVDSVEHHIKLRLETTFGDVIGSEDWEKLVNGIGLLTDVLDRMLDMLVSALQENTAAHTYQRLVRDVLEKGEDGLEAGACRDRIEAARCRILAYLQKRWINIRALRGFNEAEDWVLKAVADGLDIMPKDLLLKEGTAKTLRATTTKLDSKTTTRTAVPSRTTATQAPLRPTAPVRSVVAPTSRANIAASSTSRASTTDRSAATRPAVPASRIRATPTSTSSVRSATPSQPAVGSSTRGTTALNRGQTALNRGQKTTIATAPSAQTRTALPARAPRTADPPKAQETFTRRERTSGTLTKPAAQSSVSSPAPCRSPQQRPDVVVCQSPAESMEGAETPRSLVDSIDQPPSPKGKETTTGSRVALLAARFSGDGLPSSMPGDQRSRKLSAVDTPQTVDHKSVINAESGQKSQTEESGIERSILLPSDATVNAGENNRDTAMSSPVPTAALALPTPSMAIPVQRHSSSPVRFLPQNLMTPTRAASVTNLLATRASVRRQAGHRTTSFSVPPVSVLRAPEPPEAVREAALRITAASPPPLEQQPNPEVRDASGSGPEGSPQRAEEQRGSSSPSIESARCLNFGADNEETTVRQPAVAEIVEATSAEAGKTRTETEDTDFEIADLGNNLLHPVGIGLPSEESNSTIEVSEVASTAASGQENAEAQSQVETIAVSPSILLTCEASDKSPEHSELAQESPASNVTQYKDADLSLPETDTQIIDSDEDVTISASNLHGSNAEAMEILDEGDTILAPILDVLGGADLTPSEMQTLRRSARTPPRAPRDPRKPADEPRTPQALRTLKASTEEIDATPRNKPSFTFGHAVEPDLPRLEKYDFEDATPLPQRRASVASPIASKCDVPATTLSIGIPCIVWPSLPGAPPRAKLRALVKYIGPVDGYVGTMIGVEVALPLPEGLRTVQHLFNRGSVNGKQYFSLGPPDVASKNDDGRHTPTSDSGYSTKLVQVQGESLLSAHMQMMAQTERQERRRRIERLQAHVVRVLSPQASIAASIVGSPESLTFDARVERSTSSALLQGVTSRLSQRNDGEVDDASGTLSDAEPASDQWHIAHDRRSVSSSAALPLPCAAAVRSASSSRVRSSRTKKRHSAQVRNLFPFPSDSPSTTRCSSPTMLFGSRHDPFGNYAASEIDSQPPSATAQIQHRPSFTGSLYAHFAVAAHRRPSMAGSVQSAASARLLSPHLTGGSFHMRSASRSSSRLSSSTASVNGEGEGWLGLFVTPEQVLWVFDDV